MSGAALPLQAAIYSTLTTALTPTKVYDRVPPGTAFPYVTIGEATATDWSALAREGEDIDVTIHVWSRYAGRKECREIMEDIKTALHGKILTVTGWTMANCRMSSSLVFDDPDGLTTHGVMIFRVLMSR